MLYFINLWTSEVPTTRLQADTHTCAAARFVHAVDYDDDQLCLSAS